MTDSRLLEVEPQFRLWGDCFRLCLSDECSLARPTWLCRVARITLNAVHGLICALGWVNWALCLLSSISRMRVRNQGACRAYFPYPGVISRSLLLAYPSAKVFAAASSRSSDVFSLREAVRKGSDAAWRAELSGVWGRGSNRPWFRSARARSSSDRISR